MDAKLFFSTLGAVLLAEMGDKTQLLVLAAVARTGKPWTVFLGASVALVLVTAAGAAGGQALTRVVPGEVLEKAAACGFILIGALMLAGKL